MRKSRINRNLVTILSTMCILFLTSCGDSEYSVKTNGNSIIIEIPSRTVGISGINEVSYGSISLNEVAEAVYNEFHGISGFFKSGNYDVYLKTKYKNKYGETEYSDKGKICTLNTDEMKRYESSYYFSREFTSKIDERCRPTNTIRINNPWNYKASTSQYQEESEPTAISNQNENVAPNNNNQLSESDQYVKEVISIFMKAYFYINWDDITIEQIDDVRNEVRAKLRALNGKYNYVEGEESPQLREEAMRRRQSFLDLCDELGRKLNGGVIPQWTGR